VQTISSALFGKAVFENDCYHNLTLVKVFAYSGFPYTVNANAKVEINISVHLLYSGASLPPARPDTTAVWCLEGCHWYLSVACDLYLSMYID
jgi:hypothetical protein